MGKGQGGGGNKVGARGGVMGVGRVVGKRGGERL